MTSHTEDVLYESLEDTDFITVELVPERKGLILKHCEYFVSSRRHGTTVTRRYNEFVQLHDILSAKYPYRAVCRLPPKSVVVGGGSERFLQRRRAALQRWLTLVARHPVLAHDADTRSFLCETSVRFEKPKHDEFTLAGAHAVSDDISTEEMQAAFVSDQEQLKVVQLGLGKLYQIFENVESRCSAERVDMRELGAALLALAAPSASSAPSALVPRTSRAPSREALQAAAKLAGDVSPTATDGSRSPRDEDGAALALEALAAWRSLCARLTRGLHAERAAAAAHAPHSAGARALLSRHRYALRTAREEARVARAYAAGALETLPELLREQARTHARAASLWAELHAKLAPEAVSPSARAAGPTRI